MTITDKKQKENQNGAHLQAVKKAVRLHSLLGIRHLIEKQLCLERIEFHAVFRT